MKPNLIFFRRPRVSLPKFLIEHREAQERCLAQHFDVNVISEDCDFDQVCDRYEADLAIFEVGVDSRYQHIRNVQKRSDVLKLGFLHADAWDSVRGVFIQRMEDMGVDDFVTHSVSLRDYTPEIADRTFVWPNFIEPDVFKRYTSTEEQDRSILLTGSRSPLYPWRNAVWPELIEQLPTTTSLHPGWEQVPGTPQAISGEPYARLISRHQFAAACGSMTRDIVRKHLEIPATGSTLITEDTPAARAFGFEDDVNCVFVSPDDAVDKLRALFSDADRVARIAEAGFSLVHSRHTIHNRTQIADWYSLAKHMRMDEHIIQDGPASPLRIASSRGTRETSPVVESRGVDRQLIRAAWRKHEMGEIGDALLLFARAGALARVPEALVGEARARLRLGDSVTAREAAENLLDVALGPDGAPRPDPMLWALWVRILICQGKLKDARRALDRFPGMRRPELSALRWALEVLSDKDARGVPELIPAEAEVSASITPAPEWSGRVWMADMARDLGACGYLRAAQRLEAALRGSDSLVPAAELNAGLRRPDRSFAAVGKLVRGGAVRDFVVSSKRRLLARWRILNGRLARRASRLLVGESEPVRAVSSDPAARLLLVDLRWWSMRDRLVLYASRFNPTNPEVIRLAIGAEEQSRLDRAVGEGDLVYRHWEVATSHLQNRASSRSS